MLTDGLTNHAGDTAKGPGPSWHHFRNILTFSSSKSQGLSVLNPHWNCPPCAVLCCKVARQQSQTNILGACALDGACATASSSASRLWSWHGPAGFWVSTAYHQLCILICTNLQFLFLNCFRISMVDSSHCHPRWNEEIKRQVGVNAFMHFRHYSSLLGIGSILFLLFQVNTTKNSFVD